MQCRSAVWGEGYDVRVQIARQETQAEAVLLIPEIRDVSSIYRKHRRHSTADEDLTFLVNWATLLESGVSLAASLRRLSETVSNRMLAVSLTMLSDGVERGFQLSAMISAYPQVFPAWWEAFIALGEQGGELPRVLRLLHRYILERAALRQQFLSAFITPALTASAGFVAIGVFLFGLLPRMIEYVVCLGATLPAPLGWYIDHERFLLTLLTLALTLLFLITLMIAQYFQTSRGKIILDDLRLKMPAFGILVRKYELIRIVHGLKILVGQGASIPMGMQSLAKTTTNSKVREGLLAAASFLDRGMPMPEALAAIPVLPPEGAQIISVGWASGQLETMLDKYFERLTREVIQDAREAISVILHVTLMVIAIFVTLVLAAFYMTLFFGLMKVPELPQT